MAETKEAEQLKKCPFCGGKAEKDDDGQFQWYECKDCGARAGIGRDDEGPNITAWNSRPLEAELAGALEKKVVKCCDTCDSFGPNEVFQFDNDGRCPFDSKGHRKTDCCEKWNIETLEKYKSK